MGEMVPKGGVEPPHPCGYMVLNHARLPFRHFGAGNISIASRPGIVNPPSLKLWRTIMERR